MGKIILENREYDFEQIKNGRCTESDAFVYQAFSFCQQWLNGVETFDLKTSGSTRKPKKIRVSRKQMEISAEATKAFFEVDRGSTLLCCLNTELIAGKMMLVRALEWDADLIFIKPKENPLEDLWYDFSIDFAAMVPLQVAACLSSDFSLQKLKNIQNLIIGGAPSSESMRRRIVSEKINAYQTYGMTETVSHIALAAITTNELVYQVLPGVKIGTDNSGRLWIKAPMAIEEILETNDLVEILNGSQFKWLGRSDFTINSGGLKIQPEILEPQLSPYIAKHFGDISFFIFGINDEKLGQKMILVLESKIVDEREINQLKIELKSNLPKYHLPKAILTIEKFKRTESEKINRLETIKLLL